MIGTGIGLLIAGLASGASSVVASKVASNSAGKAGDQNAIAADKQLAYLTGKDAQDQKNFDSTAAENRRQFDVTQNLNLDQYNQKEARLAPYRSIGAGATGTLADLMGVPMTQVPSGAARPPLSSAPGSAPTGTPSTSGSGGGAADLKALLDAGTDPQTAIAQFNKQYGRTTGNEATYYGPEVHGKAAIGLPDAYLSLEDNGWSITPRSGGSGAAVAGAGGTASPGFSVMPGSAAPGLSSLYVRTAPLAGMRNPYAG